MRTWKPAPPPCWETRFGLGGAQLLIRYLPLWYHAKSSFVREMQWTLYPTSLHESWSPAETSSCLWVGNQWQMQLMSQQLTVINEHNKAPQILSQLYPLLFYCQITLVYLPLASLLSHFYCVSNTKIIRLFYCLISMVPFSLTNIIFLNKSNKRNQMQSWKNLYGNHTIASRKRKIFFQRFLCFPQYPHLLQGLPSFSYIGYQGLFHWQNSTAHVA